MKTLFSTITGSRLYGTHREDSDTDIRGVHIINAHIMFYLGNKKRYEERQTETTKLMDGSDYFSYELKHFLKLCLASNPNIMEMLFAPEKFWREGQKSPEWMVVYENRHRFLSNKIRTTFGGYMFHEMHNIERGATQARKPLVEKYGYDVKAAAHVLRLSSNAIDLMQYGNYDPSVITDVNILPMLRGEIGYDTALSLIQAADQCVKECPSILPSEPEPMFIYEMQKLLAEVYAGYINRTR